MGGNTNHQTGFKNKGKLDLETIGQIPQDERCFVYTPKNKIIPSLREDTISRRDKKSDQNGNCASKSEYSFQKINVGQTNTLL